MSYFPIEFISKVTKWQTVAVRPLPSRCKSCTGACREAPVSAHLQPSPGVCLGATCMSGFCVTDQRWQVHLFLFPGVWGHRPWVAVFRFLTWCPSVCAPASSPHSALLSEAPRRVLAGILPGRRSLLQRVLPEAANSLTSPRAGGVCGVAVCALCWVFLGC